MHEEPAIKARSYVHLNMKRLYLIVLFCLSLCACSSEHDIRLNYALEFAGENRKELETVLEHYQSDPEKLAAARFLIESMPFHYGYESAELDTIKGLLTDAIKRKSVYGQAGLVLNKGDVDTWKAYSYRQARKVYDAKVITAGYLIENIDLSFKVWKGYSWNKYLSFDDFCELILPYRIGDEPLSNWRKMYHEHYAPMLDSINSGSDVVEACNVINKILEEEWFYYNSDFNLPHLDADYLFHTRVGFCRDVCDIANYAMRSVGIPTATDYYIHSPNLRAWHCWNIVRDTTGSCYPFWYTQYNVRRATDSDGRKKGKVYRDCYGMQDSRFRDFVSVGDIFPFFRNLFVKDVTENYSGKNEMIVSVPDVNAKYVYIGVFKNGAWEPVDIARVDKGSAVFRNVEQGIVYQLIYKDGSHIKTIGYPFAYNKSGLHYFKPDGTQREEVCLLRKYPLKKYILDYLNRNILGAKIEGSLSISGPKFLLYQISDSVRTNRNTVSLDPPATCRYIYFNSLADKQMELAEFVVYKDTTGQQIPLRLVKELASAHPGNLYAAANVIDGDPLTFFASHDTTCALAFDLGNVQEIKKMMFIPRNDENFIWPGDTYELFYQSGDNGWKPLGQQKASNSELHFTVPEGAIFWLRNLTKGNEEQLFIIEGGKQVFSCDIDFSNLGARSHNESNKNKAKEI